MLLSEYMGKRLLYEIVKFHKVYPIVHTLCAQLSWSHYGILIGLKTAKERRFYENRVIKNSWSVREFEAKVKANLFSQT